MDSTAPPGFFDESMLPIPEGGEPPSVRRLAVPPVLEGQPPSWAPGPGPLAIVSTLPARIAIETVAGFCHTLLGEGAKLPCTETVSFTTSIDNQQVLRARVGQGTSQWMDDNIILGEIELTGLSLTLRGGVQLDVTASVSTDAVLHLRLKEASSGREAVAQYRLAQASNPLPVS